MTDGTEPTIDTLKANILTEFKQVLKLAPADYTENCTNVVMSLVDEYIADQVAKARIDELQRLDRSIEEHPNWGFRDWHETNFMETILADRIAELRSTQ